MIDLILAAAKAPARPPTRQILKALRAIWTDDLKSAMPCTTGQPSARSKPSDDGVASRHLPVRHHTGSVRVRTCGSSLGILARVWTVTPRGLCTAGRLEAMARHVPLVVVRGGAPRAPADQALPPAPRLVAPIAKHRDEQAEHAIGEVPLHTPGLLSTAWTESSRWAPACIHFESPPRLQVPFRHVGERGTRWASPVEPVRKQCAPRMQAVAMFRTASPMAFSVTNAHSARLLARSPVTSSSAAPPSRPMGWPRSAAAGRGRPQVAPSSASLLPCSHVDLLTFRSPLAGEGAASAGVEPASSAPLRLARASGPAGSRSRHGCPFPRSRRPCPASDACRSPARSRGAPW
jgi:hypothetical protein